MRGVYIEPVTFFRSSSQYETNPIIFLKCTHSMVLLFVLLSLYFYFQPKEMGERAPSCPIKKKSSEKKLKTGRLLMFQSKTYIWWLHTLLLID